jgi:large repetitive protein
VLLIRLGPVQGDIPMGGYSDDPKPVFHGTGIPGYTIYLYDNGRGCGDTVVGADGKWTITVNNYIDSGLNNMTATQFASGIPVSAASNTWTFTLLSSTISTPAAPTLKDDSGANIPAGGASTSAHSTVSGTGTAGDIITVYDGNTVLGSATVAANGTWTFKPSTDLASGAHNINVMESNAAGVSSAHSPNITYTFSTLPGTPTITGLTSATGPVTGNVATGGTVTDSQPTLTGTGTVGDVIKVYEGSTLLGSTTVAAGGTWSFKPATAFSTGTHSMNVTETNGSGTSAHTSDYSFTVTHMIVTGVYQNGVSIAKGGSVGSGLLTVTAWLDPSFVVANGSVVFYVNNIVTPTWIPVAGNVFSLTFGAAQIQAAYASLGGQPSPNVGCH